MVKNWCTVEGCIGKDVFTDILLKLLSKDNVVMSVSSSILLASVLSHGADSALPYKLVCSVSLWNKISGGHTAKQLSLVLRSEQ